MPRDRGEAVLAAVAHAGEVLLGADPWSQRLDAVLATLGDAAGVDRCYVFAVRDVDGQVLASQTNEWSRPGVPPQIDNDDLQDLPLADAGMERWQRVLSAGGTIDGSVLTFPESEQQILLDQDITALAVVPIHVEGRWWGFVGFDLVGPDRPFDEAEVSMLRTAARMLGAAIARRQVLDSLRDQQRQLAEAVRREREVTERLRELDRLKASFLDAVSHELRTPMTVVLGLSATLFERRRELPEEQQDHILASLHQSAQRLARMLEHLLDLQRLRDQSEEIRRAPVDVAALIRSCVSGVTALGPRRVHLDVDLDERIVVDPQVVGRTLEHLLANAAVHTPEDRQVWISARSTEVGLRISVGDDGPGVAEELRERIFEPFHHGVLRRPHQPGLGSGLAMVSGLALLHGGSAWCEEREGGGAVFHVEFADLPSNGQRGSELA